MNYEIWFSSLLFKNKNTVFTIFDEKKNSFTENVVLIIE